MRNAKVAFAVIVIAAIGLAGCGDDDNTGSSSDTAAATTTTASGKEAVCDARSQLSDSVKALANPALLTGGKEGIESALDDVKTDLDDLSDAAGDTYKPQVDDVKSALD